jgi:hypothetical protein
MLLMMQEVLMKLFGVQDDTVEDVVDDEIVDHDPEAYGHIDNFNNIDDINQEMDSRYGPRSGHYKLRP